MLVYDRPLKYCGQNSPDLTLYNTKHFINNIQETVSNARCEVQSSLDQESKAGMSGR